MFPSYSLEGFRLKSIDVEKRLTNEYLILHINDYCNDHHVDGSITSMLEYDSKCDVESFGVINSICTKFEGGF